jgi:septal ring factor EnvC (AmiA/AmiB activator)
VAVAAAATAVPEAEAAAEEAAEEEEEEEEEEESQEDNAPSSWTCPLLQPKSLAQQQSISMPLTGRRLGRWSGR